MAAVRQIARKLSLADNEIIQFNYLFYMLHNNNNNRYEPRGTYIQLQASSTPSYGYRTHDRRPDDGGKKHLSNVSQFPSNYPAQHP
jgi:hypothetical protein